MKKNRLYSRLLYFIYFLPTILCSHVNSAPVFTFTPTTPTTIQVPANGTAIVQYLVTNLSSRAHTLMMVPANGIAQMTSPQYCTNPFVLGARQSCLLTLQVSGSQISSQAVGGPQVCEQGPNGNPSPFLCYQPSPANILNITVNQALQSTLYAGAQNGNVYYSADNGLSWAALTPPAGGSAINSVVATGTVLYAGAANGGVYSSLNNGASWSLIAAPAPGFAVNGLYVSDKLYIASASGMVFICAVDGSGCVSTAPPAPGVAVYGVFATLNALYIASADGNVYFSQNNGVGWTAINGQPDTSPVKTVYVAANTLYVGTATEYVYTSTALTGGGSWTTYGQSAYSLFVNPDSSTVIAGTQGGFVFSLSTGDTLGFITYTLVNSVYSFGGS
ncbi:WD40/YVTN/BNR-like repeat-containing protein [Legionella dresdenensis]|uniref:WD40/YVTN/BNR-like repeat-containing protein n=1 Tax=Legionella dresdenensis TaxID=450200 RepID=A0ABV8CGD5_9GAMM